MLLKRCEGLLLGLGFQDDTLTRDRNGFVIASPSRCLDKFNFLAY